MIRVFVADDHELIREGLQRTIEAQPDMCFAGEAADGHEVVSRARTEEWEVLLLDLSLPTLNGTEVLHRLRELRPDLRVIVLSMYPEDQYAVRLIRMGASAYLSKGRPTAELLEAIRVVARGTPYVPDRIAQALLESAGGSEAAAHTRLSDREHQVFILLGAGRTPGDIAAELNLSPSTVSGFIAKIREKLGVRSVGEIVQYAYRAGIAS